MSEIPPSQLTEAATHFLHDLDTEMGWEWKWEKHNRNWSWAIHWLGWGCRLLLLAATVYQIEVSRRGEPQLWITAVAAVLATLNIALPLVSYTFRFQQRQEVHDKIARAYGMIRTEFLSQQIDLPEAVARYKNIREQPTEPLIRNTP